MPVCHARGKGIEHRVGDRLAFMGFVLAQLLHIIVSFFSFFFPDISNFTQFMANSRWVRHPYFHNAIPVAVCSDARNRLPESPRL